MASIRQKKAVKILAIKQPTEFGKKITNNQIIRAKEFEDKYKEYFCLKIYEYEV